MDMSDEIVDILKKKSKAKYGFICLNKLVSDSSTEELNKFSNKNNLKTDTQIFTKTGYLLNLAQHFYHQFKEDPDLVEQYSDPLQYMGETLFKDKHFHDKLCDFQIPVQNRMLFPWMKNAWHLPYLLKIPHTQWYLLCSYPLRVFYALTYFWQVLQLK